jgi:tetratricopeptide (TPR) repeat protein
MNREIVTEADGVKRVGRGSLARVGDVRVLRVAGSFYDMGYQHGALLGPEIASGPIPYFREVVEKMMGKTGLGALSPLAWTALQRSVGRRVARALPDFAVETAQGIADGAGLDRALFVDGCTMPDSVMWLAARLMSLRGPGPAVAHRIALGLGCTSAVAWGDATRDGALLHARNFDYHGVSTWPQHKAVIFHAPDRGQRYVSVAAAGVALGGVTAMNEAGITLTVHQHMFTDQTALGGTPIGTVGDIVMRDAESVDDAQKILEENRPIGCWTYVVTDGHRREVLAFEESPRRRVAHRMSEGKGTFGYANIYLDPELGKSEINLYGAYWRHNLGRHRAVNERLEERRGELDPRAMAEILGDTGDPRCRVRDSIAMVMTVGSVVFRPEDGTVWVGTGDAPTSHGTFVPFTLAEEGHDDRRGAIVVEPGTSADRGAFEHFRRAYVAYLDEHDLVAARAFAKQACELAPEQALYFALCGLFAIEALDAEDAELAFDRAIALGHPDPERLASFHLWRGRARDLIGRRADALDDYRRTLGYYADPPAQRAAKRHLKRPFTARAAKRMHVDVALIDVVTP